MKQRWRGLFLLVMATSQAILPTTFATEDVPTSISSEQSTSKPSIMAQPSSPQQQPQGTQGDTHDPSDGRNHMPWKQDYAQTSADAQLVEQALALLRPFDSSSSKRRSRRSGGIFGMALYYAKELIPRLELSGPTSDRDRKSSHEHTTKKPLSEAVSLLSRAAQRNNPDALYLLAQMSFYGNYTMPKDYTAALQHYKALAAIDGNSSAQHMIGFMYATGIGNVVARDQAKALLYHTFAAQAGHTKSEMTVAFRYHSGIGTARNCDEAAHYYKKVADKAIKWYRSGPPGGRAWASDSYRLADDDGGVYGEGASVSSAGVNAQKGSVNSDAHAALDDVLEYLDLMSGKGDFKATYSLGRIHYDGQKGLNRDMKAAKRYFQIVAGQYWKRDGTTIDVSDKPGLEKFACKSAGYLGRMFLRGEGVDQNFKKALKWFQRGLKSGDAGSQNGLGLMYLHGLGVPKNQVKASDYFKAAADQDYSPAQVNMGALHLDQGGPDDIQAANRWFELAARYGHIEAFYYLAEIINQGLGRDRSCGMATAYYKSVAEKAEPLLSSFAEANEAYGDGDYELALVDYMMAAEQGYERAQANAAYMLDQEKSMLPLPSLSPFRRPRTSLLRNNALALIYWTRSAKQSNIDSMVKMGDYYLGGVGSDADMEKAASCYTAASEFHQSAQALYNLGWMHENGVGLTQDFHLAKRYYDQALETNEEAYLPVSLSLFKLRLRSAWNTLTHGRVNSIRDEPVLKKQWSLREWVSNFLQDDRLYYGEDDYDDDDLLPQNDPMPGGDDDGMYDDIIDDGILESFIIMGLAAALVWLIYYRQQRQLAHRQNEEAARNQQPGQAAPPRPDANAEPPLQRDVGLFPQPGDPALQDWAAGGIGH